MKISVAELTLRLEKFNRLSVPFVMLMDCNVTIESVRDSLLAVQEEVYLSETDGSVSFDAAVGLLLFVEGCSVSHETRIYLANNARNLLFWACGLTMSQLY